MFRNQQQRLHRCLPFFGIVLCLRQFGDVERGVLTGDEVDTVIMQAVSAKTLAAEQARRLDWKRIEQSAVSFANLRQ